MLLLLKTVIDESERHEKNVKNFIGTIPKVWKTKTKEIYNMSKKKKKNSIYFGNSKLF
jgi:hypothetical protein